MADCLVYGFMIRNWHRKNEILSSFYRPQRSWGKVIFSEACVTNSVHRGVCVAGAACVARGHAWQWGVCGRGTCMVGRVHGGGGGACVADTTRYGQ